MSEVEIKQIEIYQNKTEIPENLIFLKNELNECNEFEQDS